jgi:hypothetical protein
MVFGEYDSLWAPAPILMVEGDKTQVAQPVTNHYDDGLSRFCNNFDIKTKWIGRLRALKSILLTGSV